MCDLCSITTNQAAIIALFRVVNRYVGNLAPMPGVFPDYPAPVPQYQHRRRVEHDAVRACRRRAQAGRRSPITVQLRNETSA